MPHPLEQRMAVLRRRVRRLVLLHGLSATVAAVLAVMMLLGLCDYVIRTQDRGIRILCWLALLAVCGWTCRRYLVRPLRVRLGNVDLAVRLERHFPALEDRLVSAVEFLRQPEDDPIAGSAALRRAVIAETEAATERLNFAEALDRGPPLRAALVALIVILVAAILAAMDPGASRIALARLVNPLGDLAWPQAVVESPPVVKSLRIRLFPPAYTGWPEETAGKNIRALVGTRLRIEGTSSKPLRGAVLCFEGNRRTAARVADDGITFIVGGEGQPPLRVEKSGEYWFELTDSTGLVGGGDARGEIVAEPDQPPSATIERPTSNLVVTPQAVVPLRITAKDDLALRRVALVSTRSDRPQQPPTELPELLYHGPQQVATQAVSGLSDDAKPQQPRTISYRWELAGLKLPPGSQVAFYATATDYHGQTAKSEPRRLIVVTPEELQQRIAGRQELMLAELARALKMQRDGRGQVTAIEIRLGELRRLEQIDLDRLQAAELNQRQVNASLTSRADGIPMHVFTLLADLENNRLANPDLHRRMLGLLDEIGRLEREHLTAIDYDLVAAAKSAQVRLEGPPAPPPGDDQATAAALRSAGGHQDQVIAALEAMLGRMNQWGSYRRFYRDVDQLLRDQEELIRQTAEVGRRTLTKELRDLEPPDLADLKVLAERQLDLGRRLDRLQQEMDAVSHQLPSGDAAAAENVADAAEEARSLAISAQMHAAAGRLQENQIGQAASQHKQIIEDLQKVLDILANRRHYELTGLVKKQQQAESELADLQRRQEGLHKQIAAAAQEADPGKRQAELERLARQQGAIRQETQRMARRLERILAEQAGRSAEQAGQQMGQAGQQAGRGNAADAARHAADAAKSLADARRQLAAQRLQTRAELAMEQLARLDDALKHLCRQEQNVLDETRRLDDLQRTQGRLTRAQALSLRDLARLQESLHADTDRSAEQMTGAGAFSLALSTAGEAMAEAAAMLDRSQTDTAAQHAEQTALARLALVLEALKPDQSADQGNSGGGGGGGQGNQGAAGGVRMIEELKLLKLLQQEVNVRTRQLHEATKLRKSPAAAQRQEFSVLGEGQGRLGDLVMQMLPPVAADKAVPEELQKQLGRAGESEDANPLLAIAEQMRTAQGRIVHLDAGQVTQDMQQDIVDRIDRLLEQVRKSCKCSSASSACKPGTRPPQEQPNPPPTKPDANSSKPTKNPVNVADAAHKPTQPGELDADRLKTILSQLPRWGELPEQERQRILQMPPEEFLPKYRQMIEDYYRRLSRPEGEDDSPPGPSGGSLE